MKRQAHGACLFSVFIARYLSLCGLTDLMPL